VEAGSISVSDERIQQLAVSFTWRETSKPPRSWLTILKRDSWMQHLYGLIPPPSTADRLLEKWIGSLEDSHVSPGVLQESETPQTTAGGSGHTLKESFARLDPEDSSWKTSQVSLEGDSNLYSEAWPKAGSMRSGVVSKQAMLEPAIEENDSSSWPTVTTQEYPHYDMKLNAKGRRIPKKGKTDHSVNLEDTARLWGTPRASEWKGTGPPGSASHKHRLDRHYLDAQSEDFHHRPMIEKPGQKSSDSGQTSPRLQLNTRFVEWMMGLPPNWLVLHSFVSSETE
tara:strand:- start:1483 stop:2331 length:849 start_codon:yes stop_codon:yes gene_type:complete